MNITTASRFASVLAISLCGVATVADAAYVMPMIGGGQVGMMMAPMKHADITFDGTNIAVHVDDTVGTPMLRPLTPPDEFDPAQPWSVLGTKAYNYQYAWNPGGFITLPTGAGIWIERLSSSPELEVYLRPPMFTGGPTWPAVLDSDGARWKWSGAMQHNAYAVQDPLVSTYSASYRVYIGDETTGMPLPGYGSADVTWTWNAMPVPEPTLAAMLPATLVLLARRRPH